MADDRAPRHAALRSLSELRGWFGRLAFAKQALLILVGLWLVTVAGCPSVSVLTCDRRTQLCRFEEKALLRRRSQGFPLPQLKGASLVGSQEDDHLYSLVVHTTSGDLHTKGSRNFWLEALGRDAEEINAFVADASRLDLRVRHDQRWLLLLAFTSPVFAVYGLVKGLKALGFRFGER